MAVFQLFLMAVGTIIGLVVGGFIAVGILFVIGSTAYEKVFEKNHYKVRR